MPHVILECTKEIAQKASIPKTLRGAHEALAEQGVDKSRVKTRAIEIAHSVVGDWDVDAGQMVHITLLLLEGRDIALKTQYGRAIYTSVQENLQEAFPNCSITLEVRDMVKDTYIL